MSQKYTYDEKTGTYIPDDDNQQNTNSDEKLIAILIWAANFVIPFIAGIVAYFYYENKNEFLRNTGKESLNYGISLIIYSTIATALPFVFLGFLLLPVVFCYYAIIPIIGIIKASEMTVYIPQFTIRFIK